jgi:predicted CoA-binding protein
MRVLIVGASPKPERYAYRALQQLQQFGHEPILYNPSPAVSTIESLPVYHTFADLPEGIDTITLYVGSARIDEMVSELVALKPRRIIANPGTENQKLAQAAQEAGIDYLEACTLIMLQTEQF